MLPGTWEGAVVLNKPYGAGSRREVVFLSARRPADAILCGARDVHGVVERVRGPSSMCGVRLAYTGDAHIAVQEVRGTAPRARVSPFPTPCVLSRRRRKPRVSLWAFYVGGERRVLQNEAGGVAVASKIGNFTAE